MVFKFDKDFETPDYQSLVGKNITGSFNGISSIINVIHENDYQSHLGRFKEYISLKHPNIGDFYGPNKKGNYIFVGFEKSASPLKLELITSENFKQTKGILHQISDAIAYLHSMDYVHVGLSRPRNFIFVNRMPDFLFVKLSAQKCFKIGSVEAQGHSKSSNFKDLSIFLSKFFCCCIMPSELKVDSVIKIYKHLPVIKSGALKGGSDSSLYVQEMVDFIEQLYLGRLCEPRHLQNHPIFWSSERRIDFLVDVYEYCHTVGGGLVTRVKSVDISNEVGSSWSNLKRSVCEDLQLNRYVKVYSYAFVLLDGVRQFRVHKSPRSEPVPSSRTNSVKALDEYSKFDKDFVRGLDLYLSAKVPSFFMGVYLQAKEFMGTIENDQTFYEKKNPCFWKYFEPSFDIGGIHPGSSME